MKTHSHLTLTSNSVRGFLTFVALGCLTLALLPATSHAQGTLTNGFTHIAAISPVGDVDSWTFSATIGDRIVIRVGKISETNTFSPRMILRNPSAVQIAGDSGSVVTEIVVTATNTGTFTLNVDDVGADATGTYRLTLAKSPGAITVAPGDEGGTLTNGAMHTGLLPLGDLDVWNFTANSGDQIVVRVGSLTNVLGFYSALRLYGPDGVLVGSVAVGYHAVEVAVTATNNGTFVVVVGAALGAGDGVGGYRLTLAKSPGAITVTPGDEGGTLTNGVTHTGLLPVGDLDMWNFTASSGDRIVVRVGNLTNVLGFYSTLRLYGPDGAMVGTGALGANSTEVSVTATNTGTFAVVVGATLGGDVAGGYRLTLAKSPGAILVGPGDEGGSLINSFTHLGTIDMGDLDVWTFNACVGDGISLQITKLTGGFFAPELRLYGPDGVLLDTVPGNPNAQINRIVPTPGSYTLIVGGNGDAVGTYQLTGLGVSTGFIMCRPVINGANLVLSSVGGRAGSNYVLFTTTNAALPLTNWTPIRTNQFGAYGEFSVTNAYNPGVTQQYFRVRTP